MFVIFAIEDITEAKDSLSSQLIFILAVLLPQLRSQTQVENQIVQFPITILSQSEGIQLIFKSTLAFSSGILVVLLLLMNEVQVVLKLLTLIDCQAIFDSIIRSLPFTLALKSARELI